MKIAVFGTGGVGGYFGGRLAQAGEDVTFIARGEHLSAVQRDGLRVESVLGDFTVRPAQAAADPAEVGAADVVLVTVKAWQVPEAARQMQPMVGAETLVVPLENGVGAPAQLADALGAERVVGGLCQISAFIAGPGLVRHVGIPPLVVFGELDGRVTPRVVALKRAFERCQGVTVEVPTDIRAAMWRKFMFIAAISGVGAVTRQPIGITRRVPETRRMLVRALEEVALVAAARGVNLAAGIVQEIMVFIDSLPSDVTASMQRDLMDGRPSELEAQNGAVVRMGREAGVETPTHEFLYASLLPMELQTRG